MWCLYFLQVSPVWPSPCLPHSLTRFLEIQSTSNFSKHQIWQIGLFTFWGYSILSPWKDFPLINTPPPALLSPPPPHTPICHELPSQQKFLHSPSYTLSLWGSASEMCGLGAETLGTETFLVSVLISVPVRPKMSGLKKVSVSRDFIQKSWSWFHETQNEGLGLDIMRPKLKVPVSIMIQV